MPTNETPGQALTETRQLLTCLKLHVALKTKELLEYIIIITIRKQHSHLLEINNKIINNNKKPKHHTPSAKGRRRKRLKLTTLARFIFCKFIKTTILVTIVTLYSTYQHSCKQNSTQN